MAASGFVDGPPGAYGLRIAGLPDAGPWMQAQTPDAPLLCVEIEAGDEDHSSSKLDHESADIRLIGGDRFRTHRADDTVTFRFAARPPDADILHPYLALAAALRWRWAGCEALHAGAFAAGRGAVLLLGDKESGKSTTLAWLAAVGGVTVLADDLAIMDRATVLAGPRSIDLRPGFDACREGGSAASGRDRRTVRRGERLRVRLDPAPGGLTLAGVVVLEWHDPGDAGVEVIHVPVRDRLGFIGPQRMFPGLAANPVALLDMASVPMVRLARARDASALPAAGEALVGLFG